MTKLYKLTDETGYTRAGESNACLWGAGVTHSGTGEGALCSPGWIHAYTHPLLAVLLNPIHAGIAKPRLWEAEGTVVLSDYGLKVGCHTLTTVREIAAPEVPTEQRVRFAILCAKAVYKTKAFTPWADGWLSGKDRSSAAAARAAADAADAAYAAADAADAARAAADAADAAYAAADAAYAAADGGAYAAARAADGGAYAAARAADAGVIDLVKIAEEACQ